MPEIPFPRWCLPWVAACRETNGKDDGKPFPKRAVFTGYHVVQDTKGKKMMDQKKTLPERLELTKQF